MNKILFILIILSFSLLSCSNGLNDVYDKQEGYRVIYNADDRTGGEPPKDTKYYEEGETVTILSSSSDTAGNLYFLDGTTGYRCSAWINGTTAYAEGDTFVMGNSDVELIAQWTPYSIGDEGPGKGIIVYNNGAYVAGWRYLEAAPALWYDSNGDGVADTSDPQFSLIPSGPIITGSYSNSIGDGAANTVMILSNHPDASAAYVCVHNCPVGGKADWYLPSRDELTVILVNYILTGMNTGAGYYYWSSTAINGSSSSYAGYWDGSVITDPVDITIPSFVRPIRRF